MGVSVFKIIQTEFQIYMPVSWAALGIAPSKLLFQIILVSALALPEGSILLGLGLLRNFTISIPMQ